MSRQSSDQPLEALGRLCAVTVPVNATATLTADQVATGWITCVSTSAVTMTLPTGALLGARLSAQKGTKLDLIIDNSGSSSSGVVTVAVATGGIKSDAAATTAASFGQMTVSADTKGIAQFTLMFTSPTAYAFTRTA